MMRKQAWFFAAAVVMLFLLGTGNLRAFTITWGGEKPKINRLPDGSPNNIDLKPSFISALAGEEIVVDVIISGAENAFGVGFDLKYNPAALSFVAAETGEFFSRDGKAPWLLTAVNPPGNLVFGLTRIGRKSGGISGSGTVAKLVFRAITEGETKLEFSKSKDSICLLRDGEPVFVNQGWGNAAVRVSGKAFFDNAVRLKLYDDGRGGVR